MNSELAGNAVSWSGEAVAQLPRWQRDGMSAEVAVVQRRRMFGRVSHKSVVRFTAGEFEAQFRLEDIHQFSVSPQRNICDAINDEPIFLCGAANPGAGTKFAEDLQTEQAAQNAVVIYAPQQEPKFPVVLAEDVAEDLFAWVASLPR